MKVKLNKLYIAFDGEQFKSEQECLNYENNATNIYYFEVRYEPIANSQGLIEYSKRFYCKCRLPIKNKMIDSIDSLMEKVLTCRFLVQPISLVANNYLPYLLVLPVSGEDEDKIEEKEKVFDFTDYFLADNVNELHKKIAMQYK